ncbi:hypothetical protein H4R18_000430 [Coemansia javaensis]|uniref:Uncharacterized protein n=1 Tax=Coemansia javaensis TaxID=2761396 RepID=A0A9W8HI46_9FUNG|nr:hypothetical protein H4R18_000430 [Coemansia javaensis]
MEDNRPGHSFVFYVSVFLAIYIVVLGCFLSLDLYVRRYSTHKATKAAACDGRCLERAIDEDGYHCAACTEAALQPPPLPRGSRNVMFTRLRKSTWESGAVLA